MALRRRIDTERQSASLFAQFDEAASGKQYADAMARYEQIPAESVYKRRAKPRYDEARTLLVSEHMAAADKARTAGQCAEVRTEVTEIIRLDPRNTIAREMVRLCRPPKAAAASPPVAARPARPRPTPTTYAAADSPPRAEAPKPAAAAPAEDAPDPGRPDETGPRGVAATAVRLGRRSGPQGAAREAGDDRRVSIIAVCSCTLKDADAAARAYAKLDDKNRNLVRALCQKNGVTVGE